MTILLYFVYFYGKIKSEGFLFIDVFPAVEVHFWPFYKYDRNGP